MSFCGADFGKLEFFHFNFDVYEQVARDFVQSLNDFFEVEGSKVKDVVAEIDTIILKNSGEKKEKETDDSDYSNEELKENIGNSEDNNGFLVF